VSAANTPRRTVGLSAPNAATKASRELRSEIGLEYRRRSVLSSTATYYWFCVAAHQTAPSECLGNTARDYFNISSET
jgi:hypothetical protein